MKLISRLISVNMLGSLTVDVNKSLGQQVQESRRRIHPRKCHLVFPNDGEWLRTRAWQVNRLAFDENVFSL
jgi:hypothetical protein